MEQLQRSQAVLLLSVLALGSSAGARLAAPVVLGSAADLRSLEPEPAVLVASAVTLAAAATLAVVICGTTLAAAWCLLVTLREAPGGATVDGRPVLAAQLVRLFAGATLGTTVLTVPAAASPPQAPEPAAALPQSLDGLPLPDRPAVVPAARADGPAGGEPPVTRTSVGSPSRAGAATALHIVVAGDSLWSIAADELPPATPAAVVDSGWRALYRANRGLVGDDPDLILPGSVLRLPRPLT